MKNTASDSSPNDESSHIGFTCLVLDVPGRNLLWSGLPVMAAMACLVALNGTFGWWTGHKQFDWSVGLIFFLWFCRDTFVPVAWLLLEKHLCLSGSTASVSTYAKVLRRRMRLRRRSIELYGSPRAIVRERRVRTQFGPRSEYEVVLTDSASPRTLVLWAPDITLSGKVATSTAARVNSQLRDSGVTVAE